MKISYGSPTSATRGGQRRGYEVRPKTTRFAQKSHCSDFFSPKTAAGYDDAGRSGSQIAHIESRQGSEVMEKPDKRGCLSLNFDGGWQPCCSTPLSGRPFA